MEGGGNWEEGDRRKEGGQRSEEGCVWGLKMLYKLPFWARPMSIGCLKSLTWVMCAIDVLLSPL